MIRPLTFSTPEEHPMPWLLCRRPELLFFLFPTVHVAGQSFEPDALLRLAEGDRNRFVAVMVAESGRKLGRRVPMPLLCLNSAQLEPPKLPDLIARVRDLVDCDRPSQETGWLAA